MRVRSMLRVPVVLSVVLGLLVVAPGPTRAQDGPVVRYATPVPGPVLRGFDPPASSFGAGHRGVDLAAEPGDVVSAAADGRVMFAGAVAGGVWVSIVHDDAVTTSYGPMADLRVRLGVDVSGSQPLGRLASGGHGTGNLDVGLHWGARVGSRYIDPMSLLEAGIPRPSLIGTGGWDGTAHAVTPYEPWEGGRWWGLGTTGSPVADRPGFAYAPNPNHLLTVGGLATNSDASVLDTHHLGYDPRSVTNLSYAGRHDDPADPADPRRDQQPYGPEHTWPGPREAAATLAEQLRAQARREPGRAVDLVGHSMGGLVILLYLLEHHDPFDPTLPPIGNVVTIASPLSGSDTASLFRELRKDPLLGELIGFAQRRGRLWGDRLPLDAPAVDQMTVTSELMWDVAVAWEQALIDGTAGPLATGTRVLNLGGSRDLAVSSARTRQPDVFMHDAAPRPFPRNLVPRHLEWGGHLPAPDVPPLGPSAEIDGQRVVDHRVLPGGHRSMLETEAVREVTWRFLAGEEVVESPGHVSRVVGGTIADEVGQTAELYGIYSGLRMARNPDRNIPLPAPG